MGLLLLVVSIVIFKFCFICLLVFLLILFLEILKKCFEIVGVVLNFFVGGCLLNFDL